MGLELRQQLKLSQQLVMTPQLQQAIKLLQLSRLELLDTVQQELLENPFLEEKEHEVETTSSDENADGTPTTEELMKDANWENYLGEFSSTSKQAAVREVDLGEEGLPFEARLTGAPTLEGHLSWQMRLSDFSARDMAIAEIILGNLNDAGYLKATDEEIQAQVDATSEEIDHVVSKMQLLDPIGVASRTPQECLTVQLKSAGYEDPILYSIISDHLEDLEKRRYKPVARKFKLTLEQLKEYLDIMQTLDPMPGSTFSSTEPHYVSPDVHVYKYGEEFVIVMNDDGLPRVQMNQYYMDTLGGAKGADKEYFQERMRSAAWLMKSLYQRQRTLYKVVESIVRFQREFFEHGVTKLKPLILKEVAEDIEMHESTVSRITTSKYVSTPHGVYELKFFFNSALELNNGTQVGSESVKALIKQLISEEDPKKPLSDEKIGAILKDRLDVNIARRTVAKYRSAMDIASSSKRKQIF
ncbi:MAG: RNA polymerase factor sigma-54 [Desulfovibrio sp.]